MFQSGHRRYNQVLENADAVNDPDAVKKAAVLSEKLWIGQDNWWYVNDDYKKLPAKPTLDGEPSYEDIPQGLHDFSQPYWNADDARRYAYWSVFAGACGHVYGHNAVMQIYKPEDGAGRYGVQDYWDKAINAKGGTQMQHLKNLMMSVPYFTRVPDQSVIQDDIGEKYDRVLATRGDGYIFIYLYNPRAISIDLSTLNSSRVSVWWFNPQTGEKVFCCEVENSGAREFSPPPKDVIDGDYVLILQSLNI
jgi:hypothetical protein